MHRLKMVFLLLSLFLGSFGSSTVKAQGGYGSNRILSYATVVDGDTIPLVHLQTVTIVRKWALLTDKEIRKNQKLIRNVKKVMPYAKEARKRLEELEREMAGMNAKKRKEYVKQVEQEVLDDFYDDLEHLTFSQGKVLLKLIDRETGNNSYTLIADLRGSFRASFYNTFARMFGFNMKERFDPKHNKEDNLLERVARSVELGKL
ncbi:MAG: DUF4294 domain-containing protein [Bacteroidales bacterium]|nr:DUF4294 domain-containing protein [Bacteroidales bacterium]